MSPRGRWGGGEGGAWRERGMDAGGAADELVTDARRRVR